MHASFHLSYTNLHLLRRYKKTEKISQGRIRIGTCTSLEYEAVEVTSTFNYHYYILVSSLDCSKSHRLGSWKKRNLELLHKRTCIVKSFGNPHHNISLCHWESSREVTCWIYYISQMQPLPSKTTTNFPSVLVACH
jgi:hypothetical protein